MDERRPIGDFDEFLEQSLPEQPPEEVVQETTPWRRAMNRILIGTALQSITLQFLGLQYLLPGLGQLLLLLGYRTLRRENGWFRFSWIATILRGLIYFSLFTLNATIYAESAFAETAYPVMTVCNVLLQFSLYIALWGGIRDIQRRAGVEVRASSALGLVVFYALICLLALAGHSGWFFTLILLAVYIKILFSLRKLSRTLDEAGYTVTASQVRLSDRAFSLVLLGLLAAAIACGYLFCSRYPMDWTPRQETGGDAVEAVRDRLTDLGFPEDVLADLSDADVLLCENAVRVEQASSLYAMNDGRAVTEERDGVIHHYRVYDTEELEITHVAVEIQGERERWRIFHHFRWVEEPNCFGTEAIQLPYITQLNEGWIWDRDLSGRVLCEMDGETYTAPYYFLGTKSYTNQSIFWGSQSRTAAYAAFSLPRQAENRRGYVCYTIAENVDGYLIDCWVNYIHQDSWLQYPVTGAASPNRSGAFCLAQTALQFYPNEDAVEGSYTVTASQP